MRRILNNIKEIRKKLGLSLSDVAKRGGISKSEVYYIENGIKIPNQVTMILIGKGLDSPLHDVFVLEHDHPNIIEYLRYDE